MKKEIRNRLLSITFVSIFLIVMTAFVYMPNQENMLSALAFLQTEKNFYMEDVTSGLLLKNASPIKDEYGLKNDPYRFKVVNNSNQDITYQIIFKSNEEKAKEKGLEVLPNHYLRYSLVNIEDTTLSASTLSDDGLLETVTIKAKTTQVYDFRMWLDINSDEGAMGKIFVGAIEIVRK